MAVNILYIIDNLAFGGTERQLVELIRHIDRERFNPYLCILKTPNVLYDDLEVLKIALDFTSFSHPSIVSRVARLSRFISKNRIEIVQTFFQDSFLMAALIKPLHKVKLIGSFRDLGFWRTPAETKKMRLAYPFFSGFIANSLAVKDHFVQEDGIDSNKIKVIYNGFDWTDLQGLPRQTAGDPIIGIVANLNRKIKRVEDFIRAAANVRMEFPEARFVVVGDGQLREGLEKLALSLGLSGAVTFVGCVDNPLAYVRRFTVGVITSETEGFCNAIIEYMACGVPVVATAVGGNTEIVVEGENGHLVPVGDCRALAQKVTKLLSDRDKAEALGRAGHKTIRSKLSMNNMLASHYDYYEHLTK